MESFDPLKEFALRHGAALSDAERVDLTAMAPDSKEASEVFKAMVDAAQTGSLLAMCKCAACYRAGWGTPVEPAKAFAFAQRAASANYPPGFFELGVCYESGAGTEKNPALAAEYMLKAADEGYAMAALNVALLYYSGESVLPCKPDLAVEYAIRAFDSGIPFAGHLLGAWYEGGEKIPKSNSTAMRWYLAAADRGSLLARNRLVLVYTLGELGLTPDRTLAVRYTELGQQGDVL